MLSYLTALALPFRRNARCMRADKGVRRNVCSHIPYRACTSVSSQHVCVRASCFRSLRPRGCLDTFARQHGEKCMLSYLTALAHPCRHNARCMRAYRACAELYALIPFRACTSVSSRRVCVGACRTRARPLVGSSVV